jgi:DNA-binding response OmpR family regulator
MNRILIVDRDGEVRTLLSRALADVGYETCSASQADQAVRVAESSRPDLIVIDLDKSQIDAWQLLRRLRAAIASPIVALGGMSEVDDFARGVREGVVAFVSKPLDLDRLVATCTRVIRQMAKPELPISQERRRDARQSLMIGIGLQADHDAPMAVGELVDLSASGASVLLIARFEIGAQVQGALDLPHSKRSLKFDAEVKWVEVTDEGFAHGLEFVAVPRDVLEQLHLLLGV